MSDTEEKSIEIDVEKSLDIQNDFDDIISFMEYVAGNSFTFDYMNYKSFNDIINVITYVTNNLKMIPKFYIDGNKEELSNTDLYDYYRLIKMITNNEKMFISNSMIYYIHNIMNNDKKFFEILHKNHNIHLNWA